MKQSVVGLASLFHYSLSLSYTRHLVWVLPCIKGRHDTRRAAAVSGLQSSCFLLSLTGFGPQTKGWKHMPILVFKIQHIRTHTHKHSVSVTIMLFWSLPWGYSSFPRLLYMEPLDATVWQLSSSVKVEFLALSGILSHLSGGGLWVWTCKICGNQHHLGSYLCLCVESPGAGRPMSKVCV